MDDCVEKGIQIVCASVGGDPVEGEEKARITRMQGYADALLAKLGM